MKGLIEVRESVKEFAGAMEQRLQENDYKTGWKGCSIKYLICRAMDELGELAKIIAYDDEAGYDIEEISHEAADVGNFCMMIVDVIKQRKKKK